MGLASLEHEKFMVPYAECFGFTLYLHRVAFGQDSNQMKQFFISSNGEKRGPYVLTQIQSMWNSGKITADALYWGEGMEGEKPILNLMGVDKETESQVSPPPLEATQPPVAVPMTDEVMFKCTNCGQRISARLDQAGVTASCPACGKTLTVAISKVSDIPEPSKTSIRPAPQKRFDVFLDRINSRAEALIVVRTTVIWCLILAAIDYFIGKHGEPYLYLFSGVLTVCAILIWWCHSRAACVILLALLIIGLIMCIIDDGWGILIKPTRLFDLAQFLLTTRAIKATCMLRKQ